MMRMLNGNGTDMMTLKESDLNEAAAAAGFSGS